MTGYVTGASDSLNVNRILVPYSLSYDAAFLLEAKSCTESCPPDRKTVSIDHWGTHPVTRGITEIGFDNGHAVVGSGSMIANEQGYQVLQVQDAGSGHVLMWGDEWITYDVEWTTNPQYQVQQFWQNIVDWLNPTGHCQAPAPPR
jgi:hypothetical protein